MSTNDHRLIHAAEASPGKLPPLPQWLEGCITSHSLRPTNVEAESEKITGDPLIAYLRTAGTSVSGDVTAEVAFREIDWLLKLAFQSNWVESPGAGYGEVTGVVAADDEFGTSSGTTFGAGNLYRTSGLAGVNSGVFLAIAGSGQDVLKVGAGGTLTDEVSPSVAARIDKAGFQAPAGDIQAVADGLISTTTDFTAHPELAVGIPFKIGGRFLEPATRFDTATLNRGVTPTKIEPNKLTCTDLGAAWAPDLGAGKTIQILTGDYLDIGRTPITERAEFTFLDWATSYHIWLAGITCNSMNWQMDRQSMMRPVFSMQGLTDGTAAAEAAVPLVENGGLSMTTGENLGEIMEAGLVDEAESFVKSLGLQLENNVQAEGPLNKKHNTRYDRGNAILRMPMTARFATPTRYDRFRSGAQTSFLIPMSDSEAGYMLKIHAAKYVEGDVSPSAGRNNPTEFRGVTQGVKDPITGKMMTLVRMPYLPL
ncbi:MAG: phage tail tube protein [Pseudomonadota bacterium]